MRYFKIEPEVAGGLGEQSELRYVDGQLHVDRLHYEFYGWLGDCLVESTPCFIVTQDAERALRDAAATGVRFEVVEITRSREFDELQSNCKLPGFVWLIVEGQPEKDDFGLRSDHILVVSERALELLKHVGIQHASVEVLDGK